MTQTDIATIVLTLIVILSRIQGVKMDGIIKSIADTPEQRKLVYSSQIRVVKQK